jgi:hypothetical protein
MAAVHRVRERLIGQRTALINILRGHIRLSAAIVG